MSISHHPCQSILLFSKTFQPHQWRCVFYLISLTPSLFSFTLSDKIKGNHLYHTHTILFPLNPFSSCRGLSTLPPPPILFFLHLTVTMRPPDRGFTSSQYTLLFLNPARMFFISSKGVRCPSMIFEVPRLFTT